MDEQGHGSSLAQDRCGHLLVRNRRGDSALDPLFRSKGP